MDTIATVDVEELRGKVRTMYDRVAHEPLGEFHFECGRALAERLGYTPEALDRVPEAAVESFAGVGFYFDLAALRPGERVLDLGSGSGMDSFLAAQQVGAEGHVIGIDMTPAQLEKAERLRAADGPDNIVFQRAFLEELPLEDGTVDVVISNGVINLCPEKDRVFREIARVLRPGGRLALADIVSERQLPETVVCDSSLWAACIGGAARQDIYVEALQTAGLTVLQVRKNPEYRFLSKSAAGASRKYGVRSLSLLARRGD